MNRPIRTRDDLVRWIDGSVLGDLRTLRLGVLEREKREHQRQPDGRELGGAHFLLVAGGCMALDYLGFVFTGRRDGAVEYMTRFMAPLNDRYALVSELLWESFRHGPVHKSWPQIIQIEGDSSEPLVVGVCQDAPWDHLRPRTIKGRTALIVCASTLLQHIQESFDGSFRPWILNEATEQAIARGNPPVKAVAADAKALASQVAMIRSWVSAEPELTS